MPSGVWGLGSELPRRVPFYLPLSLASRVVPGPAVIGLLLTMAVAAAVVGTWHLVGTHRRLLGPLVGLGYGLSPFLLTRSAVGHLPLVVAAALLPWALSAMERGGRADVLRWAFVFALTGSSGAVLGLLPAAVALVKQAGSVRRGLGDLLLLLATQAVWLVPGVVVLAAGGSLPTTSSSNFETRIDGVGGVARLVSGGGFFIEGEDVAVRSQWFAAALGFVVLGLGVAGLVRAVRRHGFWALHLVVPSGVVASALVVAPLVPAVGSAWAATVEFGPLGLARESQKFWPLVGLALVAGVSELDPPSPLGRRSPATFGAVAAATLVIGAAWPGLWGADGRLDAVNAPEIDAIARLQTHDSGQTLVLPWRRYEALSIASGRVVLQPAPWLFSGGHLISGAATSTIGSSGAGGVELERAEQHAFGQIDTALRAGREVAPELRTLGIDRVLIEGSDDADFYRRLGTEAGVRVLFDADDVLLFELGNDDALRWDGGPVPVRRLDGDPTVWNRQCEDGWRLGWSTLESSADGLRCHLPSASGVLWYPPAIVAVAAQLLGIVAALRLMAGSKGG